MLIDEIIISVIVMIVVFTVAYVIINLIRDLYNVSYKNNDTVYLTYDKNNTFTDKLLKKNQFKRLYIDEFPFFSDENTIGKYRQLRSLLKKVNKPYYITNPIFINLCDNLLNLQSLNLNNNKFTKVPKEIEKLANLEHLHISNNDLTSFPIKICGLRKLKVITLITNKITKLPAEIGSLCNLKQLDVSFNQLTVLPVELGNLINLEGLNLSNNNLSSLPAELKNLTKLQTLNLYKNKLEIIPSEIINIKNAMLINESSYVINNLNIDTEVLIFSNLNMSLDNLPINVKVVWLNYWLKDKNKIKLPFECELKYYQCKNNFI